MLNFLLGYIVGSASSQPAVASTPMSSGEALILAGFMFCGSMFVLAVFLRGLKRGL